MLALVPSAQRPNHVTGETGRSVQATIDFFCEQVKFVVKQCLSRIGSHLWFLFPHVSGPQAKHCGDCDLWAERLANLLARELTHTINGIGATGQYRVRNISRDS